MKKTILLLLATTLTGCGGNRTSSGSSVGGTTIIPDGLYTGTTSSGRAASGLILDDGSYYVIYSTQNNHSVLGGAIQGTGIALNGAFTSTDAKDINLEGLGLMSANLNASFTIKQSFSGAVNYPSLKETITFTGGFDRHYDEPPSISGIAGTYVGHIGSTEGTEAATVSISTIGTVSALGSSGCQAMGIVSPRPRGNAYNVSLTFGGFPCRTPGLKVTGATYLDSSSGKIYGVGMASSRDLGFIYSGTKL